MTVMIIGAIIFLLCEFNLYTTINSIWFIISYISHKHNMFNKNRPADF